MKKDERTIAGACNCQDQGMVLTTKDVAVLVLLSKSGIPRAMQRVMLGRLRGEAKKIAKHLTGGAPSSAQVRRAAEELRKFNSPRGGPR